MRTLRIVTILISFAGQAKGSTRWILKLHAAQTCVSQTSHIACDDKAALVMRDCMTVTH